MNDPELFWANILSRDPVTIRAAWSDLNVDEQSTVYAHLQRMATEKGWSEPQRISAQAALDTLENFASNAGPPNNH
jgi:hypothetical protein